jgi:hypothetical protein
VHTFQIELNLGQSVSPCLHIKLVERGVIELVVAAARDAHWRAALFRKLVILGEPVFVQDRIRGAAPGAAELSGPVGVEHSCGYVEPAVYTGRGAGRMHRIDVGDEKRLSARHAHASPYVTS